MILKNEGAEEANMIRLVIIIFAMFLYPKDIFSQCGIMSLEYSEELTDSSNSKKDYDESTHHYERKEYLSSCNDSFSFQKKETDPYIGFDRVDLHHIGFDNDDYLNESSEKFLKHETVMSQKYKYGT